jgi:hypothetical protein
VLCAIGLAVFRLGELGETYNKIREFPLPVLLAFGGLGLLARVFYSLRWQRISWSLGIHALKPVYALRVDLLGEFVSIVLPSTLGGDGVRLLKLKALENKNRAVFFSIVIDRVVGVLTLALLTVLFLPLLVPVLRLDFAISPVAMLVTGGVLVLVAFLGWMFARHWQRPIRLPVDLRELRPQTRPFLIGIALSILGHLIYVSSYCLLFRELTSVDFAPLMGLIFIALLTRSVPLSIFGIDVSDGSVVVLATLLAIPPTVSVAVVTLLVISRYSFSVSGLLLELLADGSWVFMKMRNTQTQPDRVAQA